MVTFLHTDISFVMFIQFIPKAKVLQPPPNS